jgi:hypothetical protein
MEGLVVVALVVLFVTLLVWFAVAKIRLRGRLGGLAALVGWAELLMLAALVLTVTWWVCDLVRVAQAHAGNDQALEKAIERSQKQLVNSLTILGLITFLTWSLLTACLFLSLRGRYDPYAEALAEPADSAETV